METFETNKWTMMVGNLHLSHQFNDRHNISFDIDHIDYYADNPTDYFQRFYDTTNDLEDQDILTSEKETPINTWVSKIDYTANISENVTIEAGVKTSLSSLENDIVIENVDNGTSIIDESLTSFVVMNEDIMAGYLSSQLKISDKIDVQMGMRYEHTITNIDTRQEANVVDRNFGNWFPSIFFQNKLGENKSLVLSYSRRITRPSFFQIAPFVIFNDPTSFWSGNISLLPALTDAVKAQVQMSSLLLSFQYSHDENAIALFQPRINDEGVQVSMAENLEYRKNYNINTSLPFGITKWWEWQININGNWIQVKANYLDGPVELDIFNLSVNGTQRFTLPKKITLELTGFYQSPQFFGVYEMKSLGAVNMGVEKKFKNSQLRIAFNDIFDTNKWKFVTDIPEENLIGKTVLDLETRTIILTYSLNFGNNNLKMKKRDKTGSEEELNRFQ